MIARERLDTWYTTPEWARTASWTRAVGFLMIPGTLLMAFHIWVGRAYCASPMGWMVVLLAMWGWPLLIVWLAPVLPVLRRAWRLRRLTLSRAEASVQLATWAAMFVTGLALPDYGDRSDSAGSALSVLTGAPGEFFTPLFCVAAVLTVSLPSHQSRISTRIEPDDTPLESRLMGPITLPTNSATTPSPIVETRRKDRRGPKECHDPHRHAHGERDPLR